MGRPSLKSERREQIIDAYEVCVARYGVEGASLEKIAEEAGLARPLIRHNVGNRDDLLEALIERFLSQSDDSLRAMLEALPEGRKIVVLIDFLFDPQYSDPQRVLVAEALIAAGQHDQQIARKMRAWIRRFISEFRDVLAETHPNANDEALESVATGVTGIYFNADSLSPLGKMQDVRLASKRAAQRLVATLAA